ncbi:hypothetical protein [Bacillus sp. SH5-2]|nr:hypothetical protein [Bacillus sp. SH5-2]
MEVIYENPWLTTWFVGWFFFCLSSVIAMVKSNKTNEHNERK